MHELLPLTSGLLLGALVGTLRPGLRIPVAVVMAVVLGVLATVVSGEFKVSWAYLLFDIPLVAVSAVLGLLVARRVRAGGAQSGASTSSAAGPGSQGPTRRR